MGGRGKLASGGNVQRKLSASTDSTQSSMSGQSLMDLRSSVKNVNTRVAISALRDAQNESTPSARGIQRTLDAAATSRGAFNAQFNNPEIRGTLQRILGSDYEFRRVQAARDVTIPGFQPLGAPVRGDIMEWRLFRKGGR